MHVLIWEANPPWPVSHDVSSPDGLRRLRIEV
jgi:hypothetical protein